MENLDFCDKHNMVAYLQKSEGSDGFHKIVDFLNTCHIKYALIENPTIYVSLIEQFWQTASASTLENGDMEITATIDGKVKVVSEASIRRHIKLEDSDSISTLPTTNIFEQLALIGNMKRASKEYTGVDTSLFQTMLIQGQILQGKGSTIPVECHHTPTVAPSTSQPHHSPTLRDFIRQETEVPQPSSPTQTYVADEAHRAAVTLIRPPVIPYDSPLPRVHILGSDEGRMQPNELMELVTKLSALEKTIKSIKARRRAQFVVSDDEEEDSFNQGRKIAEIDEDPNIFLVQQMIHHDAQTQGRQEYDLEPNFEFTAPEEVYTAEPDISTANVPVSTAGAEVSTAAESLVYIRRSAAKRKDKGKAIVEESEPTQTKTKIQQEQERLGFEEAQRLQEQFDEEERQRIASVHEKASTFKPEEWDNIKAQIKADEELAHIDNLPNKELNKGGTDLSYRLNEVLFDATVKRVNTFTPMQSDDTVPKVVARSSKRSAEEELGEESSKRQKIGEGSETTKESKDKESDKLSQEQLQHLIIIVPEEGVNVEALQTKYPIIDWEVYTEDSRMYWKIIRVGNHTEVYQIFEDMLKNFDRDDLVKL
ncbi:hypothetical protein Tco_1346435 [Tanacetum coccineum]